MTREKGHADLIAALQLTEATWSGPAIHVWFVGDGPLKTQLKTLADQSLNLHRIHFVGHQVDPASWIASADGLILPSRFEGMPNVVLEAMAIGKPVIATASGGTPELQSDPPTMFLANACNPPSLADQIKAFVLHPQRRHEHVASANRLIEEKHDVTKTVRRMESILINATYPPNPTQA
jgi:glycosyltransferase involved in cell wall biosynthesis